MHPFIKKKFGFLVPNRKFKQVTTVRNYINYGTKMYFLP